MDAFPFTRQRLLSMPAARRHKWIATWLKAVYGELLQGRYSPPKLELFYRNLCLIAAWLEDSVPAKPKTPSSRDWLQFVADAFHSHQRRTGKGLSESGFLTWITTGDRLDSSRWVPQRSYRVALDNLRSAFNVGAIFRLVDAAGFETVIVGGTTPGVEQLQVAKTAMGTAEWIPQLRAGNLPAALGSAKTEGYAVIGVETVEGSCRYEEYPWPSRAVIVMGNEEYGLSGPTLEICDDFIHLPMAGRKNSINVATAFAVVAFHIVSLTSGLRHPHA